MDIRPDHVAVYIRWSTDDQGAGTTLDVQRDRCAHFVESQGWTYQQSLLFVDDGHSGATLDRPQMERLRRMVRAGEIDCVVTFKIDRLSRNLVDAVTLVLKEWKGRCHLKSATEPLDTTSDLGRAIFGILATFADFERSMIRERTSGGKERRIRDGQQVHGKPAYGYKLDPDHRGQWLEEPVEASILKRIFGLVAEGQSINQVVRLLNAESVPTRFNKEWSTSTVSHMLRNRIYLSEATYGRTSLIRVSSEERTPGPVGLSGGRRNPKNRKVVNPTPKYQGPTEAVTPLIDLDTFQRVQDVLQRHQIHREKSGSRAFGSPYLLVGIARCICGAPLVHEGRGQRGYYVCARRRQARCQESGYLPVRIADGMVIDAILSDLRSQEQRQARFEPVLAEADQDLVALQAARYIAEQELKRIDAEDQRILKGARAGEIPFSHLDDLRSSVRRDRDERVRQIENLDRRLTDVESRRRSLGATLEALTALERWDSVPSWERRHLIGLLIRDRIVFAKRGDDIMVEIPSIWEQGGIEPPPHQSTSETPAKRPPDK